MLIKMIATVNELAAWMECIIVNWLILRPRSDYAVDYAVPTLCSQSENNWLEKDCIMVRDVANFPFGEILRRTYAVNFYGHVAHFYIIVVVFNITAIIFIFANTFWTPNSTILLNPSVNYFMQSKKCDFIFVFVCIMLSMPFCLFVLLLALDSYIVRHILYIVRHILYNII